MRPRPPVIIRLHTACGCVSDRDYAIPSSGPSIPPYWKVMLLRPTRVNNFESDDLLDYAYEPLTREFDLYDVQEKYGCVVAHYRERL